MKLAGADMRTIKVIPILAATTLAAMGSAYAADLRPILKAPVAAPAFSWTGAYVGANVGGAWSHNNGDSDFGPLFPPFIVLPPAVAVPTVIPGQLATLSGGGNKSGIIGGGQIGYNWQVNQVVLGVEADAVATGLKDSTASASRTIGAPIFAVPVTQTVTVDSGHIDWMATFRGRAGFAVDRALFYVTGGGAVAEIGGSTTTLVNGPGISIPAGTFFANNGGSTTVWGWTVGGGIEWAFDNNWSVAGEYHHTDFGHRGSTFDIPSGLAAGPIFATGTSSSRLTVDQATARLNYRFGGPIVARY
jgi:outer membrane immunogenic protein